MATGALYYTAITAVHDTLIFQTSEGSLYNVKYDEKRGLHVSARIEGLPRFPPGKQIEVSDGLMLYLVGLDGNLYAESLIDQKNASKTNARQIILSEQVNPRVQKLSSILDETFKILALDEFGFSWTWEAITNKFKRIKPLGANIISDGHPVRTKDYKLRDGFSFCHTLDGKVVVWGILAYKHLHPEFQEQFVEGSKNASQQSIDQGSTDPIDKYMEEVAKYVQTPFELHQAYLKSNPHFRITNVDIKGNIFAFVVEDASASNSKTLHHVNFQTLDNLVTLDFSSEPTPLSWVSLPENVGQIRQMLIGTRFVLLLDEHGQATTVLISKEQPADVLVSDMYLSQAREFDGLESDVITHKFLTVYNSNLPMPKISELFSPQCSKNSTLLALSEERTTLIHFPETAFNCEPYLMDIISQ